MRIKRVKEISDSLVSDFARLMPQLTGREESPTRGELQKVIDRDSLHMFIAIDDNNTVIGTATVVFIRIPTGIRAWIEDVIVDEKSRGKGVGTALIWHAIHTARVNGVEKVDLTSHPRREVANKLYSKMGFRKRMSNVYRYYLDENKKP